MLLLFSPTFGRSTAHGRSPNSYSYYSWPMELAPARLDSLTIMMPPSPHRMRRIICLVAVCANCLTAGCQSSNRRSSPRANFPPHSHLHLPPLRASSRPRSRTIGCTNQRPRISQYPRRVCNGGWLGRTRRQEGARSRLFRRRDLVWRRLRHVGMEI